MPTPINTQQTLALAQDYASPNAPTILSASATVTSEQALNHIILTNTGASGTVTYELPPAKAGMHITALVRAAFALTLDLPTGTVIDGVATSGQTYTADAVGEFLDLIGVTDGVYARVATNGTWTAA